MIIDEFFTVCRGYWTKQEIYSKLADNNIDKYRPAFDTAETLQFMSQVGICPNTVDKSMTLLLFVWFAIAIYDL